MPAITHSRRKHDLVVVAHRLPVTGVPTATGSVRWQRSPGGLVTVLEPVLRAAQGRWVGWGGEDGRDVAAFTRDGVRLHAVTLSATELAGYYDGFANATLWPLYHGAITTPALDRHWWQSYIRVNMRFADAVAQAAAPDATVWVHDYQLQLVPAMLRELRPDVTIGFFLHTPFPPAELFMQLPWWSALFEGVAGADLVGFQLPRDAENFQRIAENHALTTEPPGVDGVGRVHLGTRQVRVGAFPTAADATSLAALASSDPVRRRARQIRADLGDPDTLILGIDRLDYTKGIPERLAALDALYGQGRLDPGRHMMIQIAIPSRELLPQYQALRTRIETQIGRINGTHGQLGSLAVHYLHQSISGAELAALLVAADLMLVTALRDGMNLVAKEYAACHPDGDGTLVLSEFAGAAAELHEAYLINPYDSRQLEDAVLAAVNADPAERYRRMRALHAQVHDYDVHAWAHAYMTVLSQSTPAPTRAPRAQTQRLETA